MSIVKIEIDEAVYEFGRYVLETITGDDFCKAVSKLYEGKGIASKTETFMQEKISELMMRTNSFVPRVRMTKGNIYRTENARWYAALFSKKQSIKSQVVYLTEAVNRIIVKPYIEELARLRETLKIEKKLQDGETLSDDQIKEVEKTASRIADIKKIMRDLPKCDNDILTTLLHEYVDNPLISDIHDLDNIKARLEIQEERKAKMEIELAETEPERTTMIVAIKNTIDEIKKDIVGIKEDHFDLMKKYYEKFWKEMTPEVIASQLVKYNGTYWEMFNRKINVIETFVRIKSPQKQIKTNNTPTTSKKRKKNPTLTEKGKNLIMFPYSLISAKVDDDFLNGVIHDLNVLNEWDAWAGKSNEKEFTTEYQRTYEEFRKRLKTFPNRKEDEVIKKVTRRTIQVSSSTPSGTVKPESEALFHQKTLTTNDNNSKPQKDSNYKTLMDYLNIKVKDDPSGKEKLDNANSLIEDFCKLSDFDKRLGQLQSMIDSGTVKFPGGFAITEMKKMLDPKYEPNIR